MLKGKSTIQLFDAATGAKLLEQSDTNLVTNALEALANTKEKSGILKWWQEVYSSKHEHTLTSPFYSMLPLYKRALGGVLLWDGNIPEDPSIMIPPADVTEVGHAGNNYSGDDIYRGSYNSNESGEIPGGWRHVWDFDTDKANGTVKCISLTSWHGGNVGYHGGSGESWYPRYNNCYFHSDNEYERLYSSNYGITIKEDGEVGTAFHIRTMEDGSVRLYKKNYTSVWYLKLANPSKVGLFTTEVTYTERVELFTPTNNYAAIYVYKGQIHEIACLSVNQLQHRIFNLEGEQISKKTIDLSFSYLSATRNNPAIYRDGYYYCIHRMDKDIIKADEQGREVSRIALLPDNPSDYVMSMTINDFNGEIIFGIECVSASLITYYNVYALNGRDVIGPVSSKDGNYACAYHSSTISPPYPQFVSSNDPNSPFVFYYDPTNSKLMPLVNMGYLATINNLSTPITKTAAQTMKITYEIYDE